jgi:hypothetical protein
MRTKERKQRRELERGIGNEREKLHAQAIRNCLKKKKERVRNTGEIGERTRTSAAAPLRPNFPPH